MVCESLRAFTTAVAVTVAFTVAFAVGGCRSKSEPASASTSAPASSGSAEAPAAPAIGATPLAPAASAPVPFAKPSFGAGHPDGVILDALQSVVAACKVDLALATISACANGEDQRLTSVILEKTPMAAIETLSLALASDDPRLVAVASNVLYYRCADSFRPPDGHVTTLTAEVARRLLWGVSQLRAPLARFPARSAVHAGMIAGEDAHVLAMVDAHPDDVVREEAYPHLLEFARLRPLPRLREAAKAGGPNARFALDAAAHLPGASEPERDQVCGWARSYLGAEDLEMAAAAARGMLACRGAYVDALLDEAARRGAAFRAPFATVLRDICRDPLDARGVPGTPAQCDRTLAFLESVARDPAVDSYTRGQALFNIFYQRRDKKSLALMRKYENDRDPEVRGRAKDAIAALLRKGGLR